LMLREMKASEYPRAGPPVQKTAHATRSSIWRGLR
jgi:hypothetical protein